jgi:DNA polymerase-1
VSSHSPTFLLIDGHSLAFRSYYAFAKSRDGGLRTSTGIPTSVCFGFLKSLLEVIDQQKATYVAIAFDLGEPTFRHEADENYKADRAEAPADLIVEIENLRELLTALNLQIITKPGFEADDILGTLSQKASASGYRVKILSGDQDLFQLVNDQQKISVLYLAPGKGTHPQEFHTSQVREKLGVNPPQVIDYKALCGDTSDNIPGVNGIGAKTAVKLISEFTTVEKIYDSLDQIKGAIKNKLEAGRDSAFHSKFMATIKQDVPLEVQVEDCVLQGFDPLILQPILTKLEFTSFIKQLNQLQKKFGGSDLESPPVIEEIKPAVTNSFTPNNATNTTELTQDINGQFTLFAEPAQAEKKSHKQLKVDSVIIQPQIIDDLTKLENLVNILKTCQDINSPVAWDTETTDLEPRDAELVGIGCCWGENISDIAYIPIGHLQGEQLEKNIVLSALRPILTSADYPKTCQNAKFDRLVLRCQGVEIAGIVFDTMLASYILNPEASHNLTNLSQKYLGHLGLVAESYNDLVPKGQTIAHIDIPAVANYCGLDAYTTYLLTQKLREKLEEADQTSLPAQSLIDLLVEIEQPLEPILANMEFQGIRIDTKYLLTLSQELGKKLEQLEKQAHEYAAMEFNLGSPKQLSELLFERLKLDTKKTRKTKTGYSTDAVVLEKLQGDHPIIDSILEHRTLAKLKSTYVDALPQLVRKDTHRIHTNFNQAITSTGRLSSSNPNLQNIPIKTEFSRQIRQAFLPEKDWLLVSADYSQIELRILAHLSQEPVLIQAYQNGQDVHTVTAQLLFEKEDISPTERRLGKTINFGVIYGMGAQKFARSVGVSVSEGKKFIDRFYEKYSQVFTYLETVKKSAIAQGYVTTIFGRRRYFNFATDSLRKLRGEAIENIDLEQLKNMGPEDSQLLRSAANAPIQGSSADIIKKAMIAINELLTPYQGKLLLQVHDELVFEIPPAEWSELEPQIIDKMVNCVSLNVPLVVDIHTGQNWMEAK